MAATYALRLRKALGVALLLAAPLFGGETAPAEKAAPAPDEAVDVSAVTPKDCRRCASSGAVLCPACDGSGKSYRAKIDCPECKGQGKIPCTKCDENGMVRCKKCVRRKIDGEEKYVVVSSDWSDWNKKYGGRRNISGKMPSGTPDEPDKYELCPDCEGKGLVKCPDCGGTKSMKCKKCGGTGKITGLGPCPVCQGRKKVPCPECAVLDDLEGKPAMVELENLLGKGLLTVAEYYKRRRVLVAQEKYRAEVLAARAKKAEEGKTEKKEASEPNEAAAGDDAFDEVEAMKLLDLLIGGYASRALGVDLYEEKVRGLGLAADAVLARESAAAKTDERFKAYVKLKNDFRQGRLDYDAYREARKAL